MSNNDYQQNQRGGQGQSKNPADVRTKTGNMGGTDKNRSMPGASKSGAQGNPIRQDKGDKGGFGGRK